MSKNLINKDNIANLNDLSKIKNVKVKLYAELGRTEISLKEAVEYDEGSIIPLDKLEDETIDVYVDEILIARAKVVAIQDSYGIKIVEIINKQTDYGKNKQI